MFLLGGGRKGTPMGRLGRILVNFYQPHTPSKIMAEKKINWDDIPSLDGFEVDWEYEPENPLGKRAHERMKDTELYPVLGVSTIPAKVAAHEFEEKGSVVDLTPAGVAVSLSTMLDKDKPVMVGFLLGQQKIVSKAIVKNVQEIDGKYRTGLMFKDLKKEYADFIQGLFASRISDL